MIHNLLLVGLHKFRKFVDVSDHQLHKISPKFGSNVSSFINNSPFLISTLETK
jgi:hypothetical protein